MVDEETKIQLREQKAELDPVRLLYMIRELQSTLAALGGSSESANGASPASKSLSEFLKQLPRLWKEGEVRATHRKRTSSSHYWRTRKAPFETVWPQLLYWLQRDPDIAATELFFKLKSEYPGIYSDGQLRTLQRRVQGWRRAMAKELIGISQD